MTHCWSMHGLSALPGYGSFAFVFSHNKIDTLFVYPYKLKMGLSSIESTIGPFTEVV